MEHEKIMKSANCAGSLPRAKLALARVSSPTRGKTCATEIVLRNCARLPKVLRGERGDPTIAQSGRSYLRLIGPFGLFLPDGARIDIPSKKSIALLALIATAANGERTRIWLQGILWGSRGPAQAQGSLRRELSNLGKLLDLHGAGHLLRRESSRLALALDWIDVDIQSLAEGVRGPKPVAPGEFLEGIDLPDSDEFESWLFDRRQWCREVQAYTLPEAKPSPTAEQVLGAPLPSTDDLLSSAPKRLPLKPSVAILPLRQRGFEFENSLVGIGIAEEIEMALAQLRTLFVASSRSTAVLCERLTPMEIAAQLGVRYLIDGAVRQHDGQLRIALVLIDGGDGHQVWSHVYHGTVDTVFDLQVQIAREMAPRIHSRIDGAELEISLAKSGLVGDTYQLYWKANALFRHWNREALSEAVLLLEQLLEIDPASAWAASMAAFCHASLFGVGWTDDKETSRRKAVAHYQNALRLGGTDPTVLGYAAGTLVLVRGDIDVADRLIGQALARLPAHQPTLFWGGWVDIARGNAARARERFELSLRVNPEAGVRANTITGIGVALLMEGDIAQAYSVLYEAYASIPNDPMTLAALTVAARFSDHTDLSRRTAQHLRDNGGLEQVLGIVQNPQHRELLFAGIEGALANP